MDLESLVKLRYVETGLCERPLLDLSLESQGETNSGRKG